MAALAEAEATWISPHRAADVCHPSSPARRRVRLPSRRTRGDESIPLYRGDTIIEGAGRPRVLAHAVRGVWRDFTSVAADGHALHRLYIARRDAEKTRLVSEKTRAARKWHQGPRRGPYGDTLRQLDGGASWKMELGRAEQEDRRGDARRLLPSNPKPPRARHGDGHAREYPHRTRRARTATAAPEDVLLVLTVTRAGMPRKTAEDGFYAALSVAMPDRVDLLERVEKNAGRPLNRVEMLEYAKAENDAGARVFRRSAAGAAADSETTGRFRDLIVGGRARRESVKRESSEYLSAGARKNGDGRDGAEETKATTSTRARVRRVIILHADETAPKHAPEKRRMRARHR